MADRDYEHLLGHSEHHNIKKLLMRALREDGAHTLREAVGRQRLHRLQRKLAEMLADK